MSRSIVQIQAVLDAVGARAAAATPGPWAPGTTGIECGDHWHVMDFASMLPVAHIPTQDGSNEDQRRPDAVFIAHARTDLPALLAVAKAALDIADAYAGTPMGAELHAAIDDALGEVAP